MEKIIERDIYLKKLIGSRHNGMIKVLTGLRRCGKSFLLFEIFSKWLSDSGIKDDHIIKIDLENRRDMELRDPDILLKYIDSRLTDSDMHYIMIDEIQHVPEFEDVLNSYLKMSNADVYVTGSNARFLSKDVITTFRGRGWEIHVHPLSFKEFYSVYGGAVADALNEYLVYGGMPRVVLSDSDEAKVQYLKALFSNTYISDIKQRYNIKNDELLDDLLNILASSIGSLTNPTRLVNTFESVEKIKVNRITLTSYIEYICESFLMEKAARYDVKGRKYMDTPYKYYFTDLGLRNARLNFRQVEMTHLMENLIYNELLVRGFNVDVGIVNTTVRDGGQPQRRSYEVDFVCNLGSRRYYIQSAFRIPDDQKMRQEKESLRRIDDSFRKIVIVGEHVPVLRDEDGITTMSIYDFLLDDSSLDR